MIFCSLSFNLRWMKCEVFLRNWVSYMCISQYSKSKFLHIKTKIWRPWFQLKITVILVEKWTLEFILIFTGLYPQKNCFGFLRKTIFLTEFFCLFPLNYSQVQEIFFLKNLNEKNQTVKLKAFFVQKNYSIKNLALHLVPSFVLRSTV